MTSSSLRADITALASLSENQPDYYFVHGFITGIACTPELVKQSKWQPELFGEINFETEDQLGLIQSLMTFYNGIMQNAMDRHLKLPDECQLLSSDIEGSVASGQPLPQWSSGFLKSLTFFDQEKLSDSQMALFFDIEATVEAFTSYDALYAETGMVAHVWKEMAIDMFNDLEPGLDDLLGVMRFGEELDFSEFDDMMDEIDEDDFDDEYTDPFSLMDADEVPSEEELEEQFEAMYEMALYEDSPEAYILLEKIITEFESANGEGFFDGKDEDFWRMVPNTNYLVMRSRRARVYFETHKTAQAIAELRNLLALAPIDVADNLSALANILVIQKDWEALSALLNEYQRDTVATLGAKALMLYTTHPTSPDAKAAKKQFTKANKHLVKYLTGQKKTKGGVSANASDDIREAEMYILDYGQQAWRSVEGAMGWLRKK